ncbi:MAG: PAS domain-containing protein, partial [Myxococcales bacterium]|nr:PAS domain-containing protein [Myxococcales bacterium]
MSSPTEPPTTGTQLSPRGRVLVLSLTMAAIASAGVGLTIWSLYTTAFKDQREALVAMVEGRARLIEAVARFDAVHSVLDHPAGAAAATLSQVIDAHRYFAGFGQSGEFLLGHLEDGQVQFLLKRRFSTPDAEQAIGLDSELAEPMRRALQGQHGSVIGLDYRGVEVLAAYHRVDVLDLALVAKIDTREIRTPYLQAGLASCGVLALLIIAGGLLFQRLTSPLITDLASAVSRLETAQQVAGLGHWDWNAGRNELAWNGQLARIFGRSSAPAADDASEPAYMKLVHPEDRLQVLKELQELMFDGGQRSFEHRVEVEDGEPRHVQVIAQAEHRASGTVAGIRGTVQDITDRKRHEREQHRLEQRLRRSEKMEAIGQLAGGVAHDFNNLLTVIYGHGEMLCETLPEGDGTHTSVKQMLEAARRGSELTRQMLSFSYERELAVKVLDWSELVNRMMGMLHRLLGEDISVRMECVERDVRVKADASQLEQIVLNLAINARDAMPLGGELALRIHTAEVSDPPPNLVTLLDPGSYVVLSVVDNGSGMSPATQERIFEPFFTT